jgi:hypothetical protein
VDAPKKKSGYGKPANRAQVLAREQEAWAMRCDGRTLQYIATAMGFSPEGIRRLLLRVEAREAKRLSGSVLRRKAVQNGQIECIIESLFNAYFKSQEPRTRVVEKVAEDGSIVRTTEVVAGIGDSRYLLAVLKALSDQRDLLGLNIAAAANPPTTLAEISARLHEQHQRREARQREEEQARGYSDPNAREPPTPPANTSRDG